MASRAVLVFGGIGLVAKYAFYLPYSFGMIGYTPPGAVMTLRFLAPLTIVVLLQMVARGRTRWLPLLVLVFIAELTTAVLEFSKLAVLAVLIITLLGLYLVRPRLRLLFFGAVALALAYVALSPLVPFGRDQIEEASGAFYRANLSERSEILRRFTADGSKETVNWLTRRQLWWARLNYANAQTFALRAYETGNRGATFDLVPAAIVPRLFWPDKPVMNPGEDFQAAVTGARGTSSAPGVFAEAYWNGGWPLVLAACMYIGLVFAAFTRYALHHVKGKNVAVLPVLFIGIQMGYRPDGWFVGEYVGPVATALVLHFLLRAWFHDTWKRGRRERSA